MQLPPGWAIHPQSPQHAYEVANPNNVQPITAFAQHAPAMGYPQQPAAPPQHYGYAQPPAHGGYAAPAPAAAPPAGGNPFANYQPIDVNAWLAQHETEVRQTMGWTEREANFIWLDFDKTQRTGDESVMTVRLLPDPVIGRGAISVPASRHRIFVEYIPGDHGNRQVRYYNCFNQPDADPAHAGPGECPIDKAIEIVQSAGIQGAAEHVKNFTPDTTICWQGIDLDDPSKHWVQEVDASGNPVIDPATGQPRWKAVPGVIRMKKTLHNSVLEFMRAKGDPTHPAHGYPMRLKKKKTGPDNMNVAYSAMDLDRCQIDPQLYPIAANAIDLKKEMRTFVDRDHLMVIAENILKRFGLSWRGSAQAQVPGNYPGGPGPGAWQPHPGAQGAAYNPHTGAVHAPPAGPPAWQPPAGPPPQGYGPPAGPPPGPPPMPAGMQGSLHSTPGGGPGFPTTQYTTQSGMPPHGAPPPPSHGGPPGGPPPMPQGHGGPPPGPPGPPQQQRALPPPGAPGLGQIGLPGMGGPGMPPPPPPPGMPAGTHPQAPPPGPQQAPPPGPNAGGAPPPPRQGGLTPEQLEAQLGGGAPQGGHGQGGAPF